MTLTEQFREAYQSVKSIENDNPDLALFLYRELHESICSVVDRAGE